VQLIKLDLASVHAVEVISLPISIVLGAPSARHCRAKIGLELPMAGGARNSSKSSLRPGFDHAGAFAVENPERSRWGTVSRKSGKSHRCNALKSRHFMADLVSIPDGRKIR